MTGSPSWIIHKTAEDRPPASLQNSALADADLKSIITEPISPPNMLQAGLTDDDQFSSNSFLGSIDWSAKDYHENTTGEPKNQNPNCQSFDSASPNPQKIDQIRIETANENLSDQDLTELQKINTSILP